MHVGKKTKNTHVCIVFIGVPRIMSTRLSANIEQTVSKLLRLAQDALLW